jgi:hypothetical protein
MVHNKKIVCFSCVWQRPPTERQYKEEEEEEEEEEMLVEHEVLSVSLTYKRGEDRERTDMADNVTAANDVEASVSSVAVTLSTDNDDNIDISSDGKEI